MSFKNTNFSNNYGNKIKEDLFDKICTNFEEFKGKKLGKGTYGSAYDLQGFDEFFQNNKQVVVKEINTGSNSQCVEKSVEVHTRLEVPTNISAFYCEGDNTVLAEYYISLAASLLKSENFIDTYIYKDCINRGRQYIFMEKIDITFREYIEKIKGSSSIDDYRQFDALVVQLLHGLWCLHTAGINHNDSKADNIFLKKADGYITKDGRLLQEFDCVQYDFGSGGVVSIPVKDIKYIVKIGDFGLSQKYSEPAVLTDYISQEFMLDYLSPFYDIMLAFADINDYTSPLYKTIQTFILGFDESINFVSDEFDREKINKSWSKIKCTCNTTCSNVKTTDDVIKTYTPENLKYFLKNNFDTFARCIFWNKKDANKDRRQIYNFKLSQMKNSDIDVDRIIGTGFFQEQLNQYGWNSNDSHSILPFGGPGNYEFPRIIN